ncbi:5799_t:CDS:1, partial [Paraglomus brasilianum]
NIENLDVKVAERLDDRLSMIEDTVCKIGMYEYKSPVYTSTVN